MKEYQKRVKNEKQELDKKIKKLDKFMDSKEYKRLAIDEEARLGLQLKAMKDYSSILGLRINAFQEEI